MNHVVMTKQFLKARTKSVFKLWNENIESEEDVHDLRVEIRRLRAALKVFKKDLPKEVRRRANRSLRRAQRRLGIVRDWDVAIQKSKDFAATTDHIDRLQMARTRRQRALARVRASLRKDSWRNDLRGAIRRVTSIRNVDATARKILDKRVERVRLRLREIESREDLHRLRLSIKKLRYAMECFEPAIGRTSVTKELVLLKKLQYELGKINDPQSIEEMINCRVVGAARNLPQGILDDIRELSRWSYKWDVHK